MKRFILGALALMAGYYLLLSGQEPQSQESLVVMPREASLASIPERRTTAVTPAVAIAEEDLGETEARRVADEHIEAMRDQWGIKPYHDLHWENTYSSPLGRVVKYKVYQGDLPLVGMDVEVRVNREAKVADTAVHYTPVEEADLSQPSLTEQDILDSVSNRYEAVSGSTATPVLFIPTSAVASFGPELAIAMTVRRRDVAGSEPVQAIFRARDGQILDLTVARAEFK